MGFFGRGEGGGGLVGCFSMIVWTPAVLSVVYACVLYFLYLPLFSAVKHVSHGKAL